MKKGYLLLENGAAFAGCLPSWQRGAFPGEIVFTTGMCGYCESLTDPSFAGQILVFTYPLIGNYGIADRAKWESKNIQVAGVVVNESCVNWSHHTGLQSLSDWLEAEKVPLLTHTDTRALTKMIREKGTLFGVITDRKQTRHCFNTSHEVDWVAKVSTQQKASFGKGPKRVILVDCGLKQSILRQLLNYPIEVVQVPYNYDYTPETFDGVLLSNGPGDPRLCEETIAITQKAMKLHKPIFGICLGSQILALAAGGKTYKLPFGHRGQNQPCIELESERCYLTAQNHGYAIDEKTLSGDWKITLRNLNDQTVEGIRHKTLPFYGIQFHPEAAPGPTENRWFFERFYACL
ncbi:MAG: glutamine-hydrolyzing carbamoyl-phosphate synthase small subunit [Chlamydiales bacterium]